MSIVKISDHLNDKLLAQSQHAKKFLAILDEMQSLRIAEIERFKSAQTFGLLMEKTSLKRFAEEWYTKELYETDNLLYYHCLKANAYSVFSRKGQMDALLDFLTCFFIPVLNVPDGYISLSGYVPPKPAILLNDWEPYDQLPEDEEIAAELNDLPTKYVPTLIDKTWLDFKHQLTVHVNNADVENMQLLEFAAQIIPLFMPMANWPFVVIDIDYYTTI